MRLEKTDRTTKMNMIGFLNKFLGLKMTFCLKEIISIIISPRQKMKSLRFLKNCYRQENDFNYERKRWRHGFRKLLLSSNEGRYTKMIDCFYNDKIEFCKPAVKGRSSKVTVVCAVKNDLLRIQAFIEHYKKLGF